MWGRLPGARAAPPWVAIVHRFSGAIAFVLTLPVAFHCIWAIGFRLEWTETWTTILQTQNTLQQVNCLLQMSVRY